MRECPWRLGSHSGRRSACPGIRGCSCWFSRWEGPRAKPPGEGRFVFGDEVIEEAGKLRGVGLRATRPGRGRFVSGAEAIEEASKLWGGVPGAKRLGEGSFQDPSKERQVSRPWQ